MGTYHADKGATILGDCYHGMSARVSQALGLGTDTSAWVKAGLITDDEMRGRNYAHWTLFALDVCWALYFGRESLSAPEKKDTPMPFISSDRITYPSYFPPSTSLFLIARKIVQLLDDLSHPNTAQKSLSNDQAVTQIEAEPLEKPGKVHSAETDATLYLLVVLYPPPQALLQSASTSSTDLRFKSRTISSCANEPQKISWSCSKPWSNLYTLRYNPVILLQVAFSAGTIFLLLSLQAALSVRIAHRALQTSLAQIELCIQNLDDMGKSWHSASRTTDILRGTQLTPS
ncbi:hypothetical protein C8J57DRAFT_1491794 [Mycena rebaudengoi]|nr:hypothetical protein C8J57DRAFT_1491794 [Mycena rebaudengoi]